MAAKSLKGAIPYRAKSQVVNLTAGQHVSRVGHEKVKMGAGKQFGPGIGSGYLISGKGNTKATGGPFTKASSAKRTKG